LGPDIMDPREYAKIREYNLHKREELKATEEAARAEQEAAQAAAAESAESATVTPGESA
jgi:hypothetical protein